MADSHSGPSFFSDRRGVSAVLGFILLFGILVLSLATYQAQIVPQENAATEFQHFEDVRDEMVVVRNSISTAGQQDISEFEDVTLGTSYQTRVFTINPPPASGTLQTSDSYNITIENETAQTNVSTRFLEYNPRYFEIDVGSIWYEHSVLYLDERDRGNGVSIIEDQNILKDNTVRITALQNQFREGGTDQIAIELYPQENLTAGDGDFPTGSDLSVTIPTRLDNESYWDDELSGKEGYEGVDIDARSDGVHALNLTVGSENLEINTVGTQSEPNEEPAKNVNPLNDDNIDNSDSSDNPDYPTFDEVSVSVTNTGDTGSGNKILEVTANGELSSVDSNGAVQIELLENNGDQVDQNSIEMNSPFTLTADGDEKNKLDVDIRLLDGDDNIYQECSSNSRLEDGSPLDLSDFSCN